MAINALTGDNLAVIDSKHLKRCRRNAMTEFTGIGGLRMSRRFADSRFCCRNMAGDTTVGDCTVINQHGTDERRRRHAMTSFASIGSWRMGGRFTNRH